MRTWHKWALVGPLLVAAGVTGWLLVFSSPGEHGEVDVPVPVGSPSPGPDPTDPVRPDPPPAGPQSAGTTPTPDTAAAAREGPRLRTNAAGDALASNSFMEWMDASFDSVFNSTPDQYRQTRMRAERGDADAAFWLHWYFYVCASSPRTDWQLERSLAAVQERIDELEHEQIGDFDEFAQLQHSYRLCSILEPDVDAGMAALEWLQTAADLGHDGARRLYHYQARLLLTANNSNLAFREPGRIAEFKVRAADYAQALLETGHPQGYLLLAEMYQAGAVYPRDFVKSYAYALAANAFDGMESDTRMMRTITRQHLSPSQLRDAERMAADILERR